MKWCVYSTLLIITVLSSSAAAQTTLSFWWSQESGADQAFLEAQLQEFEAANPNIQVELQVLAQDQYLNALNLAFRGNTPPDVFRAGGFSSPRLEGYIDLGWLLPLNEYITDEVTTQYPPNTLIEGTVIFDGQIYSLPYFYTGLNNMAFLYYNKRIFEEAGLTAPPRTWDEVRDYARRITEAGQGRYWGWAMQPSDPPATYAGYLATAAADGFVGEPHPALDYSSGRYNATHPSQVAAVEFLRALNLEDQAVIPGWESLDFNTMQDTFAQGRVGMILGFAAYAGNFATTYGMTEEDFGIAPMPTQTGEFVTRLPRGAPVGWFAVSSRTENPEAAAKLFAFVNSQEFYEANARERGHVPPLDLSAETLSALNFTFPALIEITNAEGVLRPDPLLRNSDWDAVLANFEAPQPQLYEIHAQYITGQIDDYLSAANQYDENWNAELDRAIAEAKDEGASVCSEVLVFSSFDGVTDFTNEDYEALPACE